MKGKRSKVLFIQLPLVDHGYNYIDGNIPYAPAALSSFLKKGWGDSVETERLPLEIANLASDRTILKYVKALNPEIVSFSVYLWNAERCVKIASGIKKALKDVKIIFGGPEINEESYILSTYQQSVDIFSSGEGEWFYRKFLNREPLEGFTQIINGNRLVKQPGDELIPTEEICEPVSDKMMNPYFDGSLFIELTRGCPYRCSYCYYSKSGYKVRDVSFEKLLKVIDMKKKFNISEIYILSPTFNLTKNFRKNLEHLKSLNHGIKLHTELRADGVDAELAKLIREAGFQTLEVGLQTLNKESLERVGRRGDVERDLVGMTNLKNAGIRLNIGVIPGLPSDTPDSFRGTIDRLVKLGFDDSIEFYPLMLLPGTRIRSEAESEGYTFQRKPPYFIISNKDFSYDDIIDIKSYMEDVTGYSSGVRRIPDFTDGEGGYCKGAVINEATNIEEIDSFIETSVFTYYVQMESPDVKGLLNNLFTNKKGGSELYNVVFETDSSIDERELMNFLEEFNQDDFYRRSHLYDDWKSGNRVAFYQITDDIDVYFSICDRATVIDPLFRLTNKNADEFLGCEHEYIPEIVVDRGVYLEHKEEILELYEEYSERLTFVDKSDLDSFRKDSGCEYVDYPVRFYVRRG